MQSIVGCVTHGRVISRPFAVSRPGDGVLAVLPAASLRAPGTLRGAEIEIELVFLASGPESDRVPVRYAYALLDRDGAELLVWHFHPNSNVPAPAFPHMHVSAALRPASASGERGLLPLDKRHLPTGVVSLAAFVRMLIEEFGVEPLARDWQARLAEA